MDLGVAILLILFGVLALCAIVLIIVTRREIRSIDKSNNIIKKLKHD